MLHFYERGIKLRMKSILMHDKRWFKTKMSCTIVILGAEKKIDG